MESIKLIECPRDAIQGYKTPISTQTKIDYYQMLLKVGFDTIDCGSFVSSKVIPQMADTAEVIQGLDCSKSKTKLLTIVSNLIGAEKAVKFEKISYLGYPFSVSENFQVRNTGKTIEELSKDSSEKLGALAQTTSELKEKSEDVRGAAQQLTSALRSPNVKGRWGEVNLKRILEFVGLAIQDGLEERNAVKEQEEAPAEEAPAEEEPSEEEGLTDEENKEEAEEK